MSVIERLSDYLKYSEKSINKFEAELGFSNGVISKAIRGGKTIGSDKLERIFLVFPELSPAWLLTGEGEMLIGKEEIKQLSKESSLGAVPFWNLHVSAGHSVLEVVGQNKPDGYIKGLPGADIAENIFPVSGASMEPEVSNGAIIGVRNINNWETLNTERIYMIITKDDRMIKRIEYDNENNEILWCVSPNYPKFKIYKADIVEIQRVCFVYNPK